MMKKLMAVFVTFAIVFSLAACNNRENPSDTPGPGNQGGNAGGGAVTLKVWGAQEDQAMLSEMIDAFKAANPDKDYSISLGVVGEPDAKMRYLEDPAAAADVFAFSNDQLRDLVSAGGLYEITRNREEIISANSEGSINAAMFDEKLYGYPMTADNGYFLYYDKSVISEEDVKTLDGILKAANNANKKVLMDVSDGWYIASFFLGAGGKIGIDGNGKQTCDFNNARGLEVAEAIKKFCADPAFMTGDNDIIQGGMGGAICAAVSGTWNAEAIQAKLGDNYAATKLPTFTCAGEQVQMASFGGYKLIGVNSQTAHPVEAMDLAQWLTNEENQLKRFRVRAMGPSNVRAAADEDVKANAALAALSLQSEFAVPQNDVLQKFWDPAEAFGTALESKDYSRSLQDMLDEMVASITA